MKTLTMKSIQVGLITLLLSSCGVQNAKLISIVSPDNLHQIDVFIEDRGAVGRPKAKIYLYDIENMNKSNKILIFQGDGGWPVDAKWSGSKTIIITFCDPYSYTVKSNIPNNFGQSFTDNIRVYLFTSDNTEYLNKNYCVIEPE